MCLTLTAVLAAVLAVTGRPALAAPASPPPATPATAATAARPAAPLPAPRSYRMAAPPHAAAVPLCPAPKPGYASCDALLLDIPAVRGMGPNDIVNEGWGPADLQSAYNLPSAYQGDGQTVAVIEDGDSATAESDLAIYRATYDLPPCTTANGCFRKVNQEGKASPLPIPAVSDWAGESALDVDMVSAICPRCHMLLVEADDQAEGDLARAAYIATTLGAKFVSNSYGFPENPTADARLDTYYRQDGIVMTASTGDDGYGVSYPAASPNVIAVGGTSLLRSTGVRGWAEIAWSEAGSGCSAGGAKPAWQHDLGCAHRTTADVSAVADPYTGVSVYSPDGWGIYGGTSVSAPIVAAAYALAGPPPSSTSHPAQYPYLYPTMLNDVVGGTNSFSGCGPADKAYLCTAGYGYDGPTGLGTPNGVGALRAPGWSTVPGLIDGNANISVVAATAVAASTSDLFTVVPGSGVWLRTLTNGIWASSATKVDATTTTLYIAAATDGTGAVHLLMDGPDGVWERVNRNGTWAAAVRVDANPSVGPIAATTDLDGAVHLFMSVPDGGVSYRRYADSTWSTSTTVDTNGTITAVSAACDITGAVHLFMTVPNSGVWTRTLTGSTWSGSSHLDATQLITGTAATLATDGTVHLLTKISDTGVYDRTMTGSDSWAEIATIADPNVNITAFAAVPEGGGIVHLITRVAGIGVFDRVANPR